MFRNGFREGEVMIEVMSQLSSQEKLKLPKNIRQIGLPEDKKKIYVEDYVVTYMNQLASEYPNRQSAAVLLGYHVKQEEAVLTFINGAIGIPSEVEEDQVSFCSDLWEDIYGTMKKYFHSSEIVGWFLTRPGKSLGINEKITKIHVDQFPGREKTLFLMDPLDQEDAFFLYENGKLTRQHGYYIYYERNEDMQSYMVETRKGKGREADLSAANVKRPAGPVKSGEKNEIKKHLGRRFGGTVVAALAFVALGITVVNRFYPIGRDQPVSGEAVNETVAVQVVEGRVQSSTTTDVKTTETVEGTEGLETDTLETGTEETAKTTNVTATKKYTVRKGDTLANISLSLYDTRNYIDTICEINDITNPDLIYEGMVLELP